MAIIFLGTSNCIGPHSAVTKLRTLTDEVVVNASIGSSSSMVGLYLLTELTLSPGDVVFLDYAITDNGYMTIGLRTAENVKQDIVSIVAYLAAAGCLPVLLINPEAHSFNTPTAAEHLHLASCREVGVPVVSVTDLLRPLVARGAAVSALMYDAAHQTPAVTAIVGQVLLDAIVRVRALGPTTRIDGLPVWRVRSLRAAQLVEPARHIHRSSSLRSSEMALMTLEDAPIRLDVAEGETLLGVMVNSGAAGANVRVSSGTGELVRDLRYSWDNRNPNAYMLVFATFRHGLRGGPNGLVLDVLPQDAAVTELAWPRPDCLDLYGEVHIEGTLIGHIETCHVNLDVNPSSQDLLEGRYEEYGLDVLRSVG